MKVFTVVLTEEKEKFVFKVVTVFDLLIGNKRYFVGLFGVSCLTRNQLGQIINKLLKVKNLEV